MFQLRQAHLDALDEVAERAFHRRAAQRMRRALPKHTKEMPDDALLQHITLMHARANHLGITSMREVTRFVGLSLMYGAATVNSPKMTFFIKNYYGTPEQNLRTLFSTLKERAAERTSERSAKSGVRK